MVWRLTGLCSEMGLPAGAGLTLNVSKSLLLLLLRRWKAWQVVLLPIFLACCFPCQPSMVVFIRNVPNLWELLGKVEVEEHMQVYLEGSQMDSKLSSLLRQKSSTLAPVSSLNVCWGWNRQKLELGGSEFSERYFIFWSQTQNDWRLLLSDGFCLANMRWAVRRGLLLKEGIVSKRNIGAWWCSC